MKRFFSPIYVGSCWSEARDQRPEIRGQRSETRDQTPEIRDQRSESQKNKSPRQSAKAIRLKCRLCCVEPREPCTPFTAFWPPGTLNCKAVGAANICAPAFLMMKWRVHQGGHSEESQALLEDRETLLEEVLLCPPKQRATANTKQCLLKVSPLWWNEEYTRERIQRRARLCWKTEKLKRYFCVPPKQGATEQKENNAFSKSAFNDEMKGTPEMEENSYPLIRMEEPQGHVWRCRSWRSWTSRLCTWRSSRSRSEQVTSGS